MTDTTAEPSTFTPVGPQPRLRDLVRVRFVLEDHQEHPSVIIDILRRPSIPTGTGTGSGSATASAIGTGATS